MKWTAFLFLTLALHFCTQGLSQQVSITGKDLRLEQVFKDIRKQTGLEFLYQSNLLDAARPVTLDVKNMQVDEVLKICLLDQKLKFSIRSGTVIIFSGEDPSANDFAIDRENRADSVVFINGRVTDARGMALERASVELAGSRIGTQTDRSGSFTLKVAQAKSYDSLVISYVGLKTVLLQLQGRMDLGEIRLEEANNILDEAVIMAYGYTSERFRTGDIVTVKAAEIERMPVLNVMEALSGRVPGLYVRQSGSNPASVYKVQLRGLSILPINRNTARTEAISVLSKPLIVIDGLPMPADVNNGSGGSTGVDALLHTGAGGGQDFLYWMNPSDIESVTVLKDAEASSLYGSRAANGVIIITTKKGKPGKTSLNITANTGINMMARRLDLLNTKQYLQMRNEAWVNTMRAGLPVLTSNNISYTRNNNNSYDLLLWDTTRNTDWQRELLRSVPVHHIHIDLNGGDEQASYRVAAGYNRSQTSYPAMAGNENFNEEKGTVALNLLARSSNKRFRLEASFLSTLSSSVQATKNPEELIFVPPNAPAIYNAEGKLNFEEWRAVPGPAYLTPHFFNFLGFEYRSNRFTMLARANISYRLWRSLNVSVKTGYLRSDARQRSKAPGAAIDPLVNPFVRSAVFSNGTNTGFTVEPGINYTINGGRHSLDIFAGGSFLADNQHGSMVIASGYSSDELMNSPAGATSFTFRDVVIQRRSVSSLFRLSYRYSNEWLLNLSGRRDGSSSFGPERRYGNFGSVGLGWIFTANSRLNRLSFLRFGKIRGSYGLTGAQSADPYAYQAGFTPTPSYIFNLPNNPLAFGGMGTYQDVRTYTISRAANQQLGWVKTLSLDLGIDLYFLDDQRLKFSAQWYRKRTGNQLVVKPVSAVTGVQEYLGNLEAKVENTGVEITLDYTSKIRRAGLGWQFHFNIASNRNKLLSFPGLSNSGFSDYYTIGESITWQQVYKSFLDTELGIYRVVDADHPVPVLYSVNNYPSFTGGVETGLTFKGFSLTVLSTFAKQDGFRNLQGTEQAGMLLNVYKANQSVSVIEDRHWQGPADYGMGGGLYAAPLSAAPKMDIYWGDASYITIKNATLNYSFPRSTLKKIGVRGLDLYVKTENLLLLPLSKYEGYNPEEAGLAYQVPLRRIIIAGFSINF